MTDERGRFIKRILDAENRYPVESWRIGNIHIWPFVRNQLFFSWFNSQKIAAGSKSAARSGAPRANVNSGYLRFIWKGILSFIRLKRLSFPVSDFLFSGAYTHRINNNGSFYNRYFDPLIEEYGEGILLEYQRLQGRKTAYAHAKSVYELEDYLPWFQLKHAMGRVLSKERADAHLPGYDDFLADFSDVPTQRLQPAQLHRTVVEINVLADAYEYFLKKTKARYLFGLCYYNSPMYGMSLAARRQGAIAVDMQHGTQGSSHIAYATWSKMPARGYALLPHWFWVWDRSSYIQIREWSAKTPHKVYLGGNPALMLKDSEYSPRLFQGKPVILYTLQPLGQVVESYIVEAIKLTGKDYSWWLRFHPRHTVAEKEEIRVVLERHGLEQQVNLREANELPLPVIMDNAAVHLSRFSGSVIEGVQMGVPTIVTDQTGADAFAGLLESGEVNACINGNVEELVKLIGRLTAGTGKQGRPAPTMQALRESMERFVETQKQKEEDAIR